MLPPEVRPVALPSDTRRGPRLSTPSVAYPQVGHVPKDARYELGLSTMSCGLGMVPLPIEEPNRGSADAALAPEFDDVNHRQNRTVFITETSIPQISRWRSATRRLVGPTPTAHALVLCPGPGAAVGSRRSASS